MDVSAAAIRALNLRFIHVGDVVLLGESLLQS